jgi:hypothetical protein
MTDYLKELTVILTGIGYEKHVKDKTLDEVLDTLKDMGFGIDELDEDEDEEEEIEFIKADFLSKFKIPLTNLIDEETLIRLFRLLVSYKLSLSK